MADLWRTRLVWAGIGAGAAVIGIRIAGPGATRPPIVPVAAATGPDAESPHKVDPPIGGAKTGAARDQLPTTPPPTDAAAPRPDGIEDAPVEDHPTSDEVAAAPPADPSPRTDADNPPEPSAAPSYPLPRMPGMTNLRRIDRFDEGLGRWVLTRASRVPAPVFAVESFFTKALQAEGMAVTRVDEPPAADGTRRVTLRARSKRAKAQVAIRQRAGELNTTARVIWQPSA